MRMSDVVNAISDSMPIMDLHISTTCPTCNLYQTLGEATYNGTDPLEAVYTCRDCDEPVLIVSTPGVIPWQGRGMILGDWMIRNPTAVNVQHLEKDTPVHIPAHPHALD